MSNRSGSNKLRIAMLLGSGTLMVTPLLAQGFNVVGIADVEDELARMSSPRRWLEKFYWAFIKRKPLPYLSHLASNQSINYFDLSRNGMDKLGKWLTDLNADVMVCHQTPLLPPEIFSLPKYGTINIHPALLPKYRGANPYFWQYYHMDMIAGVTLHFIDEKIDTGEIIAQSSFPITLGQKAGTVREILLYQHAIPLLIKTLESLQQNGMLESTTQAADSPTPYARRMSNDEYIKTVGFEDRPLNHVWHLLHSTGQWRDCFVPTGCIGQCCQWDIAGRQRQESEPPFGVLKKDRQGYFISHHEGRIDLSRKLSLKKVIKVMLGM